MPSNSEYRKSLRERRKSQGLCITCGKPSPDKVVCPVCAERTRRCGKKREDRSKESGVCAACHKIPAEPNRGRCKGCLEKLASNANRIRKSHDVSGKCNQCGSERAEGRKLCQVCIDRGKSIYKENREKCICVYCGKNPVIDGISHCEKCRNYTNIKDKVTYRRLRKEVFLAYGGFVCVCCGEKEEDFLQIDHIDGGGSKHRRSLGSASKLYRWLKTSGFPSGFQILCANCNHAKGRLGICPHERKRREAAAKELTP